MLLASKLSRQNFSLFALLLCSLFAESALAQTLRFQDVTDNARVATPNDLNGYGHGVAAGDFNNDGLPDIYVVNYTALNALFLNNGNGTFNDAAAASNAAHTTALEDRGVAAADYDNDGDLDLYIATAASANKILYRNNGNGSFSDATNGAGLSDYGLQGQGVSWGDYDGDGDLDLFLCSYDQAFKLYRQNGDHTFDDVSSLVGLDGSQQSVQAVFFDFDLDNDLDIFVGRGTGYPNRLFVNSGNGRFTEESASRNLSDPAPHAQGIAAGDYDNDGDLDLYMCDDRGPNRLYRNDNGVFSEVAAQAGVADASRSLGCTFADFDNDGWLDLYVINFGANRLYRNNGNGTFTDQSSGSGADNADRGYGSAVLDYDNDGLLDIFFSNSGQNSNLLRNTTATSNKWLKFKLRGVSSNRNGIGARVLVTAGGVTQTQQLLSGYAMVSGGGDLTLHFGLANNTSASRVEVLWPSGTREVLNNVNANQALTIQEGSYPANDNTAPIISNLAASNLTNNGATITWSTNEASDSQVEYGTSTSYGVLSPLEAARVTAHTIILSNLSANTTYHYRVRSKDAAGNLATSANFTFTTLAITGSGPGVIFSDNFNSAQAELNASSWLKGTNSGNQTAVANNALELRSNSSQSGWVVTQQSYSARNTTVTVKITQPNDDGTLGMSPTFLASATDGIYNQPKWYRFYVYREDAGDYRLYAEWKKSGVSDGVDVTGNMIITPQSGVYLRLRFDDTRIYFEASLDNVNWSTRYSETFGLAGYSLDSKFYYELAASRTPSRGVMSVDDFSILGPGAPIDTQTPIITNVVSANVTSSSATITWKTNEASDTQLEYGTSTSYGVLSPLNAVRDTSHSVTLTGLAANTTYHYRVRSRDAAGNLALSHDFTFQTNANSGGTLARTILNDPLNGGTLGTRTGGQFENTGGWRVTAPGDMLVYDLGTYLESGSLEIELSNFRPTVQNSYQRHHFLSMFRSPWGNHHPQENVETVWDLHAGTSYAPGVKLLSWTYNENEEKNTILEEEFDQSKTYRVRMAWSGNQLQYFLDGVLQATHTHSSSMQVRYLYVGRDFTVSGDFVTNFNNNQYPGLVGPIYENLVVTENVAASDAAAPVISNLNATALYANAARLAWATNEAATGYLEYGLTTSYGQRTPVLGPPTQTHEATLAALQPNQLYHYRIVTQDNAGNITTSSDNVFTTKAGEVFLFKPLADTFVERGGVHGTTRDRANFGWTNLLVSSNHETYLRFQVAGLNAPVRETKLRVRTRQAGTSNATVRALLGSWSENTATWLTKPTQYGDTLGTLNAFAVNQWRETALKPFVANNGTFNFALLGTTAGEISLDARESTNFQPELIITLQDTSKPVLSNVAASNVTFESATIAWLTNEASTSQIEYGLSTSYGNISALDTNRVTAHAMTLAGLQSNTLYHYRVLARDAAGNLAVSENFTFTTLPNPGPPVISSVVAQEITNTSARITFTTNYNASGSVEFDTTAHGITRLMPLGDSITEGTGSSDEAGYRSGVYTLLTDFGSRFDLVGSLQYGEGLFDKDHEGHAGAYANDILAKLKSYLQQSRPEAVLLHIGTNDVSLGDHYGTVTNEIAAIVDTILAFNPRTKVYLSTLIPRRDAKQSVTLNVNAGLPEVVAERAQQGSKIFLVDNSAAFLANPNWAAEWMIDHVHPNDAGYEVMAQTWQKAYRNTEYENRTSNGPLVTTHTITLNNLAPGRTYHYRARAQGGASLETASANFTFTTLLVPPAPVITNIARNELTHESVRLTWTTDRPADSQVEYGLSTSYGFTSTLDTAQVIAHDVMLAGLSANTTYHFRVKSRERAGNLTVSPDSTFTTKPAPLPTVALHGIYEITLRSQQITPNNYVLGPSVSVTFQGASGAALGTTMTVQGFWEGGDWYRVRFAPNKTGDWSWQSYSSDAGLNNKSGAFTCAGTLPAPHISQRGHVRESKVYPYTFAHADSTPFFLLGDTQWSFATDAITWPTEFQTYVDARAAQGFNYVHGLIYNVYPQGNEGNEGGFIFRSSAVDSLNPAFFRALDQRVAYMNAKGLVVGLMFAWGNGGWLNFETTAQVDRFVRYVINRYAAYNVFWITAGEYEEGAPVGGYTRLGELVVSHDVYDHPTTTHTINTSATAFGNAAWHTTIYQQIFHSRQVTPDRSYNKPVINSEYGYEGDQSAEEVRQDAWQIVMRGGFGVYGDTTTFHYHAVMTQAELYSPGAAFMTILKNFWTGVNAPAIAWQRFTRFEVMNNMRFLAGRPGAEYVAYAEARGAFAIDLSDALNSPLKGGFAQSNADATIINGQWFDTRTGNWGATFSAPASAAFVLTPPDSGYAAYLKVVPPVPPPVLTQVQTSNVTHNAATITWQTDKPADTQVEYGFTADYGTLSALDTIRTLSHQITLTNLAPNTLYHFRARSRETSNVLGVSTNFTFTTLPTPPLFADSFNTATLDLNKWQRGTNSENQSAVMNNALELRSQSAQSGWVITKPAFIAQNTTVTVKVTQPNDDGDLGMSPTFKLNSATGIYSEENWYRFYLYREEPGNYRLYVEWLKAGVKDGLDVTGNLTITAQSGVYLRLRMDDTRIYFEASLDGQQWLTTYSEVFSLPGYTLSNKFYYELSASRTASRGVLRVDDFVIEGALQPRDTQAPAISNVTANNLTPQGGATIMWTTNEASDAQVEYGLTSNMGTFSPRDSSLSTTHTITLTNLTSDTTYHFRVLARDAAGNLATSAGFTFKTLASAPSNVLLADDFSGAVLDANKWLRGTNSGNQAAISNGALQLQSTGSQSGWVVTKQTYIARNTTVAVKVTQPNHDGALGMSPTYSASSTNGFHNQNNWYRFYVYREQASGPYRLYVEWKKGGVLSGFDVTGDLAINGMVYLRLRFDEAKIYFEASLDNLSWVTSYSETFALSGVTLNSPFFYELSAYRTATNGVLLADDFSIRSNSGGALTKASLEEQSVAAIPESFALSQNYPNPFNIETRVQLALPEPGRVQVVIYNLNGQEVRRLHDGVTFQAGTHTLQWHGDDERNATVSSGVYVLRVIFEGESGKREVATRRFMLMK